MSFVLYLYVPALGETEVRSLLLSLAEIGYSVTHLGKKDPPKKWSGTREEAVASILSGRDLTLSTFIRDAGHRLDMTVEIRRDPRWNHSTISASLPEQASLRLLGETLFVRIRSFAAIVGRSGGGKDQAWSVLRVSEDCPPEIAANVA